MLSLNKVVLAGNLARDPELRRVGDNSPVCDFTVAVTRKKPRVGGEETSFIDCTAWGKVAEFIAASLKKGAVIIVEGRLTQDRWQDKGSGQSRSKLKVTADSVQTTETTHVEDKPNPENLDDVQF